MGGEPRLRDAPCSGQWRPHFGEDVGRSTFFHRHAVLHDQHRENWDEGTYSPLANLQDNGPVPVLRPVLSEEAVLAFEYGYATSESL